MRKVRTVTGWVAAAWVLVHAGVPAIGQAMRLTIDPARSQVLIDVGKAGVFGFAGHAHEVAAPGVRGAVTLDPADWGRSTVAVEFETAALRVTGKGEPASDVPQVQQVMLSARVLDVSRFPVVAFRSRRVSVLSRSGNTAQLQIDGDVTLHGVTRPLSVRANASLDAAGALTTRGTISLKQTDFGIDPVTAAGGSVRVRDDVAVQFALVAHQ